MNKILVSADLGKAFTKAVALYEDDNNRFDKDITATKVTELNSITELEPESYDEFYRLDGKIYGVGGLNVRTESSSEKKITGAQAYALSSNKSYVQRR